MPAFRLTRALSVRAIACSIALFSSAPAGADGSVSALGMAWARDLARWDTLTP